MSFTEDRRNPHVSRVALTTLVDICAQDGADGPFQAESLNVSGRGMQVQTSYLPSIGEQLVCRFEHEDREVLVEGRVAWRAEGEDSGEFGIQFTALDADSAHVLEELGARRSSAPPTPRLELIDEEQEDEPDFVTGERVRLHIDGLSAPMKAAVHEANERKIRVGSNLEFLTAGRRLELESVEGETRRGASVDSVNVVVNPTTGVPELVVQLRYEGSSATPAPGVAHDVGADLDFDDDAFGPIGEADDDGLDDDEGGWEPKAEALRARLGGAWSEASRAASKASDLFGKALGGAKSAAARAMPERKRTTSKRVKGAATPVSSRRQTRRRSPARAPSHLRSGIHDLGLTGKPAKTAKRSARHQPPPVERRSPKWGRLAAVGLLATIVAGSAFGLRSLTGDTPALAEPPVQKEKTTEPKTAQNVPSETQAPTAAQVPVSPDGIVADVPLFGPKAMATAEPVEQEEEAAADGVDDATAERLAAAAAVEDESWNDEGQAKPADVEPWGRGRLHLPTVHRIRLDGPGQGLSGTVEPSGFTVVVPGGKAMESGRAIEKRDKRIVQVKASNTARGARVRFEFRGPVPPYRVRLRKDFVEFLISAPEEGVAQL